MVFYTRRRNCQLSLVNCQLIRRCISIVKIKICGLSRPCDIDAVNEFGPDYIGFVFAESRRRVTPEQALALRRRLRPGIVPVGVFVDEDVGNIVSLANSGVIEMVQLHGSEDEGTVRRIKKLTGKPVIKAVAVQNRGEAEKWNGSAADFLLLDHIGGGTGEHFDWNLIGKPSKPFFLAGGIGPEIAVKAVKTVHPYAIDASSGVETDGLKDRYKIQDLVRRIRHE